MEEGFRRFSPPFPAEKKMRTRSLRLHLSPGTGEGREEAPSPTFTPPKKKGKAPPPKHHGEEEAHEVNTITKREKNRRRLSLICQKTKPLEMKRGKKRAGPIVKGVLVREKRRTTPAFPQWKTEKKKNEGKGHAEHNISEPG